MKINFVKAIISVGISALIAYGFYSYHGLQDKMLICSGSFTVSLITLLFSTSISFALPRTTVLVRTVSVIFFTLGVISNLIFDHNPYSVPAYIITNGILLLVYTMVAYAVYSTKQ